MQLRTARGEYMRWLAITRNRSGHTLRAYCTDIRTLERYLGPEFAVSEIDRAALVGFLEAQQAVGLAPSSLKRRASAVRGFCRWLVSSRCLEHDPWVNLTVSLGRTRKLPRVVPAGDLERLLATLQAKALENPRAPRLGERRAHDFTTFLAVAVMVGTGVRVNELVRIECQDVDLVAGRIRVLGKGRRERHVYLTSQTLVELVEHYLSLRPAVGVEHDRLFFAQRGAPLTTAAMRSRLARAAEQANIQLPVTPHMLRHSAATKLLEAGVDIRVIQRLLGHASLTTTEIYTHVSDRALQRTLADADVIGGMLVQR